MIWKPVPHSDYQHYHISNTGVIKNTKTNKILKPGLSMGYHAIVLYNNYKTKNYKIYRLLAELFIPNPNKYKTVNHKDGNKLNNSLDNLEWCTYKYNLDHALKTGLRVCARGSKSGNAKLVESDILKIRQLYKKIKNYSEVGRRFGVHNDTIKNIIIGKTWTHV